jgi:hypothetical protein
MCRSIHTLYHIEPPATQWEIHAASLQFVRKISGYSKPSKANEPAFDSAVDEIEAICTQLLNELQTSGPVRARESAKIDRT